MIVEHMHIDRKQVLSVCVLESALLSLVLQHVLEKFSGICANACISIMSHMYVLKWPINDR